jgi:adenylate kinase family enzyme
MRKIHIIGSVGSGKSTLARRLSDELNIPYYELDNVVWRRVENGNDIRNSPEIRDAMFADIIGSDAWIVEGAHYKWVSRSLELADTIDLDTPYWTRNYRIMKRFVVQGLGLEQGNYRQTFAMLMKMYKWNYEHQYKYKPVIMELLQPYRNKLLIMRDNTDLPPRPAFSGQK